MSLLPLLHWAINPPTHKTVTSHRYRFQEVGWAGGSPGEHPQLGRWGVYVVRRKVVPSPLAVCSVGGGPEIPGKRWCSESPAQGYGNSDTEWLRGRIPGLSARVAPASLANQRPLPRVLATMPTLASLAQREGKVRDRTVKLGKGSEAKEHLGPCPPGCGTAW